MLSNLANIRNVNTVKALAKTCSEDQELVEELIRVLAHGKGREVPQASWVLNHTVEMNPGILNDKCHSDLLDIAREAVTGTVKRNLIRNWQFAFPKDEQLKLGIIELAFQFFSDRSQDLAVRVFSLTVLEKYLAFMPEIMNEVLFLIEKEMPEASASFTVRARRFIKSADKLSKRIHKT